MEEKNKYKPTCMKLTKNSKIEYVLSKADTTKLQKLTNEEIVEYINVNYIDNYDNDRSGLVDDLRVFKTYKDDLEIQNNNYEILESFIDSLIPILAIFVPLYLGLVNIIKQIDELVKKADIEKNKIMYKEILGDIKIVGYFLIGVLVFKTIIFVFRNIGKIGTFKDLCNLPYSRNNKLVSVSYAIHTLESIKEENYYNPDYSEKTTEKAARVGQGLDDNSKDSPEQNIVQKESTHDKCKSCRIISRISNYLGKVDKSYNLSFSNSEENNIQIMDSVEIRKYINEYYNNEHSIEKKQILDDLKIFKIFRDDLEMSLEDDTIFLSLLTTYNAIVASGISLMLTISTSTSKNLEKFRAMITDKRMLDGISLMKYVTFFTIVLVFVFYIHRLFKKSSYKRLKSVKFGINVLEDKKEKIESEKKD